MISLNSQVKVNPSLSNLCGNNLQRFHFSKGWSLLNAQFIAYMEAIIPKYAK